VHSLTAAFEFIVGRPEMTNDVEHLPSVIADLEDGFAHIENLQ
jgi:hypothetical protein